jgi:hypothetical protein
MTLLTAISETGIAFWPVALFLCWLAWRALDRFVSLPMGDALPLALAAYVAYRWFYGA